jgi:hypothetical protein
VSSLTTAGLSLAESLLRIDGHSLKWQPSIAGIQTVIYYATLTRPYSFSAANRTLSSTNCSTMGAVDNIIAASNNVTETLLGKELVAAFNAWEKVAGLKFIEVSDIKRANIIVGANLASNGPAFANLSLENGVAAPRSLALGSGRSTSTGQETPSRNDKSPLPIKQAYICLNPKQRWKIGFDGNLSVIDLRHAFMHEIGHAIGLDHPGSSGAIMGYRYDEQTRDLRPSDIAAAQSLYGVPYTD